MEPKTYQIEIIIGKDGKVQSTVTGVAGPSCSGLADWIGRLGKVTEDENTEDFYKDDEQGLTLSAGS